MSENIPNPPHGFPSWLSVYEKCENTGHDLAPHIFIENKDGNREKYRMEDIIFFSFLELRELFISRREWIAIMVQVRINGIDLPLRITDYLRNISK